MNIDDLSKIHTGQDTRVSFSWVEPSSSTPTDLTGGHVRLKLERTGLKSYAYEIGSDTDPELVEWTNRAAGTGAAMLQLTDEPLPLGLMRFQLRSIKSSGEARVQRQMLVRVVRTLSPAV